MAISDWHENDRPREKLLKFGAHSLSDAELLAIFLRVGVQGKSAVDLAQDLLDHFGSLHALLNADETTFCQAKGLGQAKFVQLKAVLEISRRHFESGLQTGDTFNRPEQVAQFLHHSLGHQSRERFGILLLDTQNRFKQFDILFEGTLNSASVHPREVVKHALLNDAAKAIIAHNHPSGDPTPSAADLKLTQQLHQALDLVEIPLLDHIIIGDHGRWHAFSQHHQL